MHKIKVKPGLDTSKTFMLALIMCLIWSLFMQWGYYTDKIKDNEKRIYELECIIHRNTILLDKNDKIIDTVLNTLENITRRR